MVWVSDPRNLAYYWGNLWRARWARRNECCIRQRRSCRRIFQAGKLRKRRLTPSVPTSNTFASKMRTEGHPTWMKFGCLGVAWLLGSTWSETLSTLGSSYWQDYVCRASWQWWLHRAPAGGGGCVKLMDVWKERAQSVKMGKVVKKKLLSLMALHLFPDEKRKKRMKRRRRMKGRKEGTCARKEQRQRRLSTSRAEGQGQGQCWFNASCCRAWR